LFIFIGDVTASTAGTEHRDVNAVGVMDARGDDCDDSENSK